MILIYGGIATNKWEGETTREWGTTITMDGSLKQRVDDMWDELDIFPIEPGDK